MTAHDPDSPIVAATDLSPSADRAVAQASIPVLLARRPASVNSSSILTATDSSANALRAARWSIALIPDARHYLLHAYSVAFEGRMRLAGAANEDIARYRREDLAHAETRMNAQIAEPGAGHQIERLLTHGAPMATLFEYADQVKADLIVIGKHGGSVLEERLLGSVTQNVLYHAKCDVLLVP